MVPFKANQLMAHILSDLNEEQINTANGFLKELLFYNINLEEFQKNLDLDYEKGGAGWNSRRAASFVKKAGEITRELRTRAVHEDHLARAASSLTAEGRK